MRNAWQEEQEEEEPQVDDEEEPQDIDEEEPHEDPQVEPHHDEATSSTTQASIADGVKARSEKKQLEAEEERARRKIQVEEITLTTIFNNRLEMKVVSGAFKKALEKVEKEEEDM